MEVTRMVRDGQWTGSLVFKKRGHAVVLHSFGRCPFPLVPSQGQDQIVEELDGV
jgi:hypothetical protein